MYVVNCCADDDTLKMRAMYDYVSEDDICLSLTEGEIIINVKLMDDVWAEGQNFDGIIGFFPLNYCQVIIAYLLSSVQWHN